MTMDAERDGAPRPQPDNSVETESHKLARDYVKLGGQRKAKIDDNITDVRQWENDPPEAERFWQDRIETLPEKTRKEVETFLPTINAE